MLDEEKQPKIQLLQTTQEQLKPMYIVRKVAKDTDCQQLKFTDRRDACRLIEKQLDDKEKNIFSSASVPKNQKNDVQNIINGKIYHIVGSKEILQSVQRSRSQEDPQDISPLVKQESTRIVTSRTTATTQKLPKAYQIDMNSQDVEKEMRIITFRVSNSKKQEKEKTKNILQSLPKGDRLVATREKRIIKKFNEQEQEWNRSVEKYSNQVKRPTSNSLYRQVENYRLEEEQRQILDGIQPLTEKYGNNLWVNQLRRPGSSLDDKNPYEFIEQPGNYYDSDFPQKKCPIIEIIRKPQSRQTERSTSPTKKKFKTKYYENKLKDRNSIFKKLIQADIDSVPGIEIIGQNVLEKEMNAITEQLNQNNQLTKLRRGDMKRQMLSSKKSFVQLMGQQHEKPLKATFKKILEVEDQQDEEIICMNWNSDRLRHKGMQNIIKLDLYL